MFRQRSFPRKNLFLRVSLSSKDIVIAYCFWEPFPWTYYLCLDQLPSQRHLKSFPSSKVIHFQKWYTQQIPPINLFRKRIMITIIITHMYKITTKECQSIIAIYRNKAKAEQNTNYLLKINWLWWNDTLPWFFPPRLNSITMLTSHLLILDILSLARSGFGPNHY